MQKRLADARVGITPLQYSVLKKVSREPVTINAIAKQFGFKPPSLVPVVDALEERGLIKRKPDANDRRKTLLVIKKKGLDLLEKIPHSGKKHTLDAAFEKFSPKKQKDLLNILEELLNNFPEQ